MNKSSRPIPSGQISLERAVVLRWALPPVCLFTSACYSSKVLGASFVLTLFIIFYNELKAHWHWFSKNLITAVGYACFEIGSTLIAGSLPSMLSLQFFFTDLLAWYRQRHVAVGTYSDFSNCDEPCSVREHIARSGFQGRRGGPPYRQTNIAYSIPQSREDFHVDRPSSVVHLPVSRMGSGRTLHFRVYCICGDGGISVHDLQDVAGSTKVVQIV
jgi:hypothetical protein